MTPTITHLVVGPPRHGVVQFGRELHAAMSGAGVDTSLWHADDHHRIPWKDGVSGLHLQFTDRLFGSSPQEAADAVAAIVARADAAGSRVTVTLHDLPQPSDGRNFHRRSDAYATVCAHVHAVVVSSEHERALLQPCSPRRIAVVPLPIRAAVHPPSAPSPSPTVGVFGYVYPGKGHSEVLSAIAHLAADVELVAIGQASDGHADLVVDLDERARELGVALRLTGYVSDGLYEILRSITVPVAPHRHISASGSLNSWLAAGRRPLAPVNRYTEEIAGRNPDVLELYPDTEVGLRTAIKKALAEPELTWLPASTVCTPTVEEAAAQYAHLLQEWHR